MRVLVGDVTRRSRSASAFQCYGYDSAAGIAAYCVDALENQAGWRGPRAECLLTELDGRVRRFYREALA